MHLMILAILCDYVLLPAFQVNCHLLILVLWEDVRECIAHPFYAIYRCKSDKMDAATKGGNIS